MIPVVVEELTVVKRVVETGKGVRIIKTVSEREQLVDVSVRRDELVIERVAINKIIPQLSVPEIRYEGETIVVPVLEEVLVTEKRTMLKEEVRITRKPVQVHEPRTVVLRSEHLTVERFDESNPPGNGNETD